MQRCFIFSSISLSVNRDAKNALVSSKQLLKEKLQSFEKKSHNRFELTEKFLKDNITNVELANDKTNEENLHLFQKVGSNFKIHNRTVLFEPRGAWKILAGFGFGGNSAQSSALRADAFFRGNALTQNLRSRADSNRRGVLKPLPL